VRIICFSPMNFFVVVDVDRVVDVETLVRFVELCGNDVVKCGVVLVVGRGETVVGITG